MESSAGRASIAPRLRPSSLHTEYTSGTVCGTNGEPSIASPGPSNQLHPTTLERSVQTSVYTVLYVECTVDDCKRGMKVTLYISFCMVPTMSNTDYTYSMTYDYVATCTAWRATCAFFEHTHVLYEYVCGARINSSQLSQARIAVCTALPKDACSGTCPPPPLVGT